MMEFESLEFPCKYLARQGGSGHATYVRLKYSSG